MTTGRRTTFLCLMTVLACLALGSAANAQDRQNSDYCNAGGGLIIVLIDVTTPYDQTDKAAIVRMINDIWKSAQGGEKLILRTISDSHTHSETVFNRCIPHCKASGMLDRLFNCSDGLIRTDSEVVRAELETSLRNRLSKFTELNRSDILRTIFAAVQGRGESVPLRLYIYSDLIENSEYFSSRYLFNYTVARLIEGLRIYKLIAPLHNAAVSVAGVGRGGAQDRRPLSVSELNKLKEFWTAYFGASGAKPVIISQEFRMISD